MTIKTTTRLAPLLLLLLWGCTLHPQQTSFSEEQLVTAIKTILAEPPLKQCNVGMNIVRIKDKHVLFARNQNKLMHPASTMKLFTTALALEHLGNQYQYTTRLATPEPEQSSLKTLYLIGTGDPSLSTNHLTDLARQLYDRGVRHIDTIICDASFLDDIHYGHGWMWDDQPYKDFAPISGLSLNQNIVEIHINKGNKPGQPVHVSTIPQTSFISINNTATTSHGTGNALAVLRDMENNQNRVMISGTLGLDNEEQIIPRNIEHPALYTGTVFMEECQKQGISVTDQPRLGITPTEAKTIARHQSVPLADLILTMNKQSQNLYAELLVKTVARKETEETGTTEQGLNLLQTLLQNWDISEQSYHFADGSGVSRYNLITPEALTNLLVHIYDDNDKRKTFIRSLPIGGNDGDLDWRMQELSQRKNVWAKTGYLRGVSTLAGFIDTSHGETLAFSIMMQHFQGTALPLLKIQDRLCEQLSYF